MTFQNAEISSAVTIPATATPGRFFLVGEQDRSSVRPSSPATDRTMICVNGRWHAVRGRTISYEQIFAFVSPPPQTNFTTYLGTISYRRGASTKPSGSLTPGDVIPLVDGLLINANVTALS